MNVDFFSMARNRRLIALDSLKRRQPDLPGFGEVQEAPARGRPTLYLAAVDGSTSCEGDQ